MANYYHEARAQVKSYKKHAEDNRRRAERRAELANARSDEPLHLITVDGRSCPVHKNTEQYEEIERMSGMVAWNGDTSCLIDRFDVRAMLDFYREYEPSQADAKTEEEKELEERLAFESFRDLVKLVRKGLRDEAGLAYVEDEALDIRVAARSKASAAAGITISKDVPAFAGIPGEGMYSNAEFSYGGAVANGDAADDGNDDEDEDDGDLGDDAEDDMIEAAEDDEAALNSLAESCGIRNFAAQLQRAVVQEEEELEGAFKKKRPKRMSRRKMMERVRRMLGQGLNPYGKSRDWWKISGAAAADALRAAAPKPRRGSPDYGDGRRAGASRPPGDRAAGRRRNEPELLTEFTARPADDYSSDEEEAGAWGAPPGPARGSGDMHEAMPGRIDPAAAGGPVALPAAGSRMYGLKEYTQADRDALRQKEAERDRIKMNRVTVTAAPGVRETPQERLKRLMAAQFNSNVAKDTRKILDKKAAEERDRAARVTIERHAAALPRAPKGPANRGFDRRSVSPPPSSPDRRPRSASPPEPRIAASQHPPARRSRSRSRSPRRQRSRSPPRGAYRRDASPGRRRSRSPPRRRSSSSRSPPRRRSRSPPRGGRRSPDRRSRSYREPYR